MTARLPALLLAAILFSGCTDLVRYALLGTREHATTEGEASIEPREDGRFDLAVSVDRLPTLDSLGEGLSHYVLWVQEDGAESPVNAGTLTLATGTRTGSGRTVIGTRSVAVRITAEADAAAASPGEQLIVAAVLEAGD